MKRRMVLKCLFWIALITVCSPWGSTRAADMRCPECCRVVEAHVTANDRNVLELAFIINRLTQPSVFVLKAPPRIVVDIEPSWNGEFPEFTTIASPLLNGPIRKGYHADAYRLRFVMDLLPDVPYNVDQHYYPGDYQPEQDTYEDGTLLSEGGQFILGEGSRFVLRIERKAAEK